MAPSEAQNEILPKEEMKSSSQSIPVPPLCFTDEETEARPSDLFKVPLKSPDFSAHCMTPGCPQDTICLSFKNGADLKHWFPEWGTHVVPGKTQGALSLSLDILSPLVAGSRGAFCQASKLLTNVRTKMTLYQAPNLSKDGICPDRESSHDLLVHGSKPNH